MTAEEFVNRRVYRDMLSVLEHGMPLDRERDEIEFYRERKEGEVLTEEELLKKVVTGSEEFKIETKS